MIIKKFQGKNEVETIDLAKKELGPNIVVMNVKSVKRKGLLRLLYSPLTEVTVALEEESERIATEKREIAKRQTSSIDLNTNESAIVNTGLDKNFQTGRVLEDKLDNLQSLIVESFQKPEDNKQEDVSEESNESESFMRLLYNKMVENEVDEKYANQIIDDIEKINKTNTPIDYMLANVYQKMILKFGVPTGITPALNNPKVVFFLGPTGVGKTTTIAKIASKFSVVQKKKIVLLTADTYRIAAAEQLRTYASILDVPFRVIYSVEELETAIKDFSVYDYIFIDTAGHSHQNETQKDEMNEFIHSVDHSCESENYLVLSTTTKYKDLLGIADTYSTITKYKLIFTKLDETSSLGNILNLRLHTGATLSYVTYGQNVPDDIEEFNPQKTVKLLLGGKRL
ncbi:MAG TPA: flagellar biosynthesis protein FlhF [Lachnospiraceae bacterium]|nr:flagellar biosynthesis protein FlhF [Lachnospiraceae bacterium]